MASDFDRGRKIGKYEILTRLSVGGMAELFLAFIPGPGGFKKFVALKQILPDVKADESFIKMFLDEARITAAFNHANIGQVFDLGEENDEYYLAMEFIAGQNLEQIMKRAAKRELVVPAGFAARVMHDAALGLHYAHHFTDPSGRRMAVVHRDVSPKNVMVTYTGQVKVIDFGIAKAAGRLNRTKVGIVKGTSGYMSPEQVRNDPLDGRTDLFAAAVMLHEMLAGERLFTASTDAGMMLKIVEGAVANPADMNSGCTAELGQVVLKGLEKHREARFTTGRDFSRAIAQAIPLFEDEESTKFMASLFDDKIALTRSLLDQANDGKDEAQMSKAVQILTTEEPDGGLRKKTPGANFKSSVTPRGGVNTSAPISTKGSSSPKLPRVAPRAASQRSLPQVNGASKSNLLRSTSKMNLPAVRTESDVPQTTDSALEKFDLDSTVVPRRSQMKLAPVSTPVRSVTGPVPISIPDKVKATHALPEMAEIREKIKIPVSKMALFIGGAVVLAVVVLVGAVVLRPKAPVGATTVEGERAAMADAAARQAKKLADEQQKAALAVAEKAKALLDRGGLDSQTLKVIQEYQAQLSQLAFLEEEQRKIRAAALYSPESDKRILDLQKQIESLRLQLESNQEFLAKVPTGVRPTGTESVNKSAEDGFLTLKMIDQGSYTVFSENNELGVTPLVKIQLEEGSHDLRLVDTEGKSHKLNVLIIGGQTRELKSLDISTLPTE
jgi:serine/threonine protein kinase